MGNVDHSSNSSTIAIIAAITAVAACFLLAPIFLDMYLRSDQILKENKSVKADVVALEKKLDKFMKDKDE
jgi:hypothetical protein